MSVSLLVNQQIQHKKIQYLYEDFYVRFLAFTTTSILIAYVSSKVVDARYIYYWLLTGACIFLIRAFSHYLYRQHKGDIDYSKFWGRIYFYNAAITGVYFGMSASVMYLSQSEAHSITIGAIVFTYTIAVMNSSVSYMPAFYIYMVFALSPFVIFSLFLGSYYVTITISALACLFSVIFVMILKGNAKVYNELLRLRFELEHEKDSAEKANSAKTKFLASASHDLRQPLHALNLFSGLLKHHTKDKVQMELLQKVDSSLSGLNNMLEKLLDMSRLDAGVLEVNIQIFNISAVLDNLSGEFASQARDKGLEFKSEYRDCYIKSDPVLLEVIIRNLLSNALKYTNKGTVNVVCEEYVVKGKAHVSISVRDTGIGIKDKYIDDIFSEYMQIDNPERDRAKGLGLGLAIVKRIGDLLKMDISVNSEYRFGSEFSFRVPVEENYQSFPFEAQTEEVEPTSIIVIDDDEAILYAMKDTFEVWGCSVLIAESEDEVISKIEEMNFLPDLIISDLRLREERTGAQAIKRIHELVGDEIPAYLLTGDTAPERLKEASSSGYELLHKPLSTDKLKSILSKVPRTNKTATILDTEVVCD